MPSTYTLISSNVLSSSAASVTFSAIPSTYTDLVVRFSGRSDTSSTIVAITFNGDTATNYSNVRLRGDGTTAYSFLDSSVNKIYGYYGTNTSSTTANTFTNAEIYIPNYLVSANKPVSYYSVQEDNATAANILPSANLWRNTAAITSITFTPNTGNLVSGSSFYLYGIKNS